MKKITQSIGRRRAVCPQKPQFELPICRIRPCHGERPFDPAEVVCRPLPKFSTQAEDALSTPSLVHPRFWFFASLLGETQVIDIPNGPSAVIGGGIVSIQKGTPHEIVSADPDSRETCVRMRSDPLYRPLASALRYRDRSRLRQ